MKNASRSFIILEWFAGKLPTLKRALHFTQIHYRYRFNVSVFMTIIRNEVEMEKNSSIKEGSKAQYLVREVQSTL